MNSVEDIVDFLDLHGYIMIFFIWKDINVQRCFKDIPII